MLCFLFKSINLYIFMSYDTQLIFFSFSYHFMLLRTKKIINFVVYLLIENYNSIQECEIFRVKLIIYDLINILY